MFVVYIQMVRKKRGCYQEAGKEKRGEKKALRKREKVEVERRTTKRSGTCGSLRVCAAPHGELGTSEVYLTLSPCFAPFFSTHFSLYDHNAPPEVVERLFSFSFHKPLSLPSRRAP
jgi:hypothetical protein